MFAWLKGKGESIYNNIIDKLATELGVELKDKISKIIHQND